MNCRVLAVLLCGTLMTAVVRAKTWSMTEFLRDGAVPETMLVKDLGQDWSRCHVGTLVMKPQLQFLSFAALSLGVESRMSPVFYSRGDTVQIGEARFLIAYERPVDCLSADEIVRLTETGIPDSAIPDEVAAQLTPRQYRALAEDTLLTLTLLNLRAAESLGEIVPFDARTELPSPSCIAQLRHMPEQKYLHIMAEVMLTAAREQEGRLPKSLDELTTLPQRREDDQRQVSYQLNERLAGASLTSVQVPADTLLIYEREEGDDGLRNVAFADGHVAVLARDEWTRLFERDKP